MVFTRCPCLLSNCAWTAVLSLLDASWTSLEANLEGHVEPKWRLEASLEGQV